MIKHHLLFAGKNLIRMVLLLFAVSVVTFALVSASPIDPLQANVGQAALGSMSEEQKEKLRSYWGVDTPPVERYLNWMTDALRGDRSPGRKPSFSPASMAGRVRIILLTSSFLKAVTPTAMAR